MKKIFTFLLLTLFLCTPMTASAKEAPQTPDSVSVGVILPFTSAFGSIANEQKNAIELALRDNVQNIRTQFKDGKSDAAGAIQAFNELMARKSPPRIVITCGSWAAQAINPLAAKNNVFHIAIGSAALTRTAPHSTVRFTLDAQQEEKQLALYLSSFTRIAIFYMDNSYGQTWEKKIQNKFSDRIVISSPYNPSQKDFKKPLSRIKAANPDAFVLLSAGTAAVIAKQARQIGITAQFIGTRPIERPKLLDVYKYTKGLVYTYPSYNMKHPFIDEYKNANGTAPTIFACEAYDAISTLSQALKAQNKTAAQLFDWYADREYTGILGKVQFNDIGDASYPYMLKQIVDHGFHIADFQFPLLLEATRQGVNSALHEMHKHIEIAEAQLSGAGLQSDQSHAILETLYKNTRYAFDCVLIDPKGIIVDVAPHEQITVVGKDISKQEQMIRLYQTHKPVVSLAIDTVEGFASFDLNHPLFNKKNKFIGSVSILTKPDIFASVITQKTSNFPVEMWMMQKNGRILYDLNPEEIGKNLFTDPLFADYPSLLAVGKQMVVNSQGQGEYSFMDKDMKKHVTKTLLWTTIELHGTEFRLALSYVKNDI